MSEISRYSYGLSYSFRFAKRLAGGIFAREGGPCPWPLEYARRVFFQETSPDEDSGMVAIVGPVDDPECAIAIGPNMGSFVVTFPEDPGERSPYYSFYSVEVGYGPQFDEMSDVDLAARKGQMFNTHVEFDAAVDGVMTEVAAQLRPDGRIRLVIGPFGNSEIRDWAPCPGLDPESLWLPVPEFEDYRSLEVRDRPILELIRQIL